MVPGIESIEQVVSFPGGEQLRSLIQADGAIPPMTCYGLEVTFPQQVFVVLRNKVIPVITEQIPTSERKGIIAVFFFLFQLNSSAEVLDVDAEPSAARALRALRLPSNLNRPPIDSVQQRFAAFTSATGLPAFYDYNR